MFLPIVYSKQVLNKKANLGVTQQDKDIIYSILIQPLSSWANLLWQSSKKGDCYECYNSPMTLFSNCHTLYSLPMYSYESPLSIDTK